MKTHPDGARRRARRDDRREPRRERRCARRHQEVRQDPHRHRSRRAALRHDRRQMQPTGLDVETAEMLAKDWGLEFEHVPTTGASRIPALQTGKADLVISTPVLHRRARQGDRLLAGLRRAAHGDRRAQESVNVKKLADLDGKTVGTVRGTTHDTQLTKEGPKGMKLVRYEDDATEAPGVPERPGRHLLDRRDDRAAARQEEPGPPGRGQVRARQLQALPSASRRASSACSTRSTSGSLANLKNGKLNAI